MLTDRSHFLDVRNEFVYSLLPLAMAVNMAGGVILLYVLFGDVAPPGVWHWFIALTLVTLARGVLFLLRRTKLLGSEKRAQQLFLLAIIINGGIWGASVGFLDHVELAQKLTILLIIVGISAGGGSSSVASLRAFVIYLSVILLPLFMWLLAQTDSAYNVTSITVVLYIFMLTAIARNFNRQYFKTLELQEQKETLANGLSALNEQLGQEIEERRRMEADLLKAKLRAEKASRSKSVFLSHLSHELRTPLNSILGFSEMLGLDQSLKTQHQDQIQHIQRSGHHLLDLVNDVLDLATIDSGKLSLHVRDVELSRILRECELIITTLAQDKGIHLVADYSSIDGLQMELDPKRLKQVVLNLLSNSIKYNKVGGKVCISTAVAGRRLQIRVEDSGQGISPEKMKDIFSPFDRIGQENSNIEGTGIGLTITKRLVEMMKGELTVESVENVGTTFTICLPLHDLQTNRVELSEIVEASANDDSKRRGRILLLEDNPVNQLMLSKQLATLGYLVECVNNGKEGLEKTAHMHFDLIFTDCNMPEMDGYEFTRSLRDKEKITGEHCPVIAITADAYQETAERCLATGMDAYLSKPVNIKTLKAVTSRWLKKS
ncbi:MAG: ATP-binding protein [Gammaproteobacteria bacterium]|nr:ATP-binding protein [Gammaproteobacteria bacterium]